MYIYTSSISQVSMLWWCNHDQQQQYSNIPGQPKNYKTDKNFHTHNEKNNNPTPTNSTLIKWPCNMYNTRIQIELVSTHTEIRMYIIIWSEQTSFLESTNQYTLYYCVLLTEKFTLNFTNKKYLTRRALNNIPYERDCVIFNHYIYHNMKYCRVCTSNALCAQMYGVCDWR